MDFVASYSCISCENYGDGFVGANSGEGFISFYNDLIDERVLRRLYVIKGAAGTGKSTFMRNLANESETAGLNVKRYMCSSDHNSLDAVIVNDSVAVIDGTNPHSYELRYPGTVSEFLDYTKFWDNSKLINQRSDIINYSELKRKAYSDAYSRLKCEMNLRLDSYSSVLNTLDRDKMNSQISRFIVSLSGKCKVGTPKRIISRSVGMRGRYRITFDSEKISSFVHVADMYGSAYVYMSELVSQLKKSNIAHIISQDPVCPNLICDVIIPSVNMLITVEDVSNADKTVNMSRFVQNDSLSHQRGFLRLSAKCIKLFADEADYYLSLAGRAHFQLEKIYSDAMNFDFLNTYSEMKIKEIIDSVKF